MAEHAEPKYLKDYQKPNYLIDNINITFDILADCTRVYSLLQIRRSAEAQAEAPLHLDGGALDLESIEIDAQAARNCCVTAKGLTLT